MENHTALGATDIVLFKQKSEAILSGRLKEFLSFLKFKKVPIPILFSYLDQSPELITTLTLKENILLEANYNRIGKERYVDLDKIIQETQNLELKALYRELGNTELNSTAIGPNKKKLVQICHLLIRKVPYLFLDNPEKHLEESQLSQLINAVKFKVLAEGVTVLLSTAREDLWSTHITAIVSRGDKNKFIVRPKVPKILTITEGITVCGPYKKMAV